MIDFVAGDTGSAIQTTCIDSNTFEPIDVTDYSISLQWRSMDRTLFSRNMEKIDSVNGIVSYTFQTNELVAPDMSFDVVLTHNDTLQVLTCRDLVKITVRHRV